MTEALAIAAVIISAVALFLQYKNTIERRHGEISNLRSELLLRLSAAAQRVTACQLHAEATRMGLRTIRDSDEKYQFIERMPGLIAKLQGLQETTDTVISRFDALDTRKLNDTDGLLVFQQLSGDAKRIEVRCAEVEQSFLALLESVRAEDFGR